MINRDATPDERAQLLIAVGEVAKYPLAGRCHFCRHWGKSDTQGADEIPERFPGGPHHKPCMHPSVGGGTYNDAARHALDGVVSYTTISTGPTFGCVHFEDQSPWPNSHD